MDKECKMSVRGMSGPISKVYGVSARTIRDIWNQKTWAYATVQNMEESALPLPFQVFEFLIFCAGIGYRFVFFPVPKESGSSSGSTRWKAEI